MTAPVAPGPPVPPGPSVPPGSPAWSPVPPGASVPPGFPVEPVVPAGPGVVPPFTAPPTDRDNKRLWLGLGTGALVLVLCCVAGVVGFGLLVAGGTQRIQSEARRTVENYLSALQRERYDTAYGMLCPSLARQESEQSFERRSRADRVLGYRVGEARTAQNEVTVDALVRYEDRGSTSREYLVAASLGEMVICGER